MHIEHHIGFLKFCSNIDKDKLNKLQDIPLRNEVQSKNLVVINKKISDNSIVENNESKQITKKENTIIIKKNSLIQSIVIKWKK